MRIGSLVTTYLKDPNNLSRLKFVNNLEGGWERWFQLELAYYYYANFYKKDPGVSQTEVRYNEKSKRCDLVYWNDTTKRVIPLEIKCQTTHQNIIDFTNKLASDYYKMLRQNVDVTVLGIYKDKIDSLTVRHLLADKKIYANDIIFYENNFLILEKLK